MIWIINFKVIILLFAQLFCSSLQLAHDSGHIFTFNYILKYEQNLIYDTINNQYILFKYGYSTQLISFSIAIPDVECSMAWIVNCRVNNENVS